MKIMLSLNSTHYIHLKSNAFENGQLMFFQDPYLYGTVPGTEDVAMKETHTSALGDLPFQTHGDYTLSSQGTKADSSQLPCRSTYTFHNSPKPFLEQHEI